MSTTYQGTITSTNDGMTGTQNLTGGARPIPAFPLVNVAPGKSASYSASVTYTVKRTWVPDSGQTMQSDPPPPSIWLYQEAGAWASGNGTLAAADGLNDTALPVSGSTPARKESLTGSPGKLVKVTVTNGVATISKTLSASGSHSQPTGGAASPLVGLSLGFATTIHAQPYNMRLVPATPSQPNPTMDDPLAGGPGGMLFNYIWSSTSGSLYDIRSTVTVHEAVNYSGPGTFTQQYYLPPSPPIGADDGSPPNPQGYFYPNPSIGDPIPGSDPGLLDGQRPPTFMKPYSNLTYTGTQYYFMNDEDTGEVDVVLRGPLSIVRSIGIHSGTGKYYYSIQKEGFTNWLLLPGQ